MGMKILTKEQESQLLLHAQSGNIEELVKAVERQVADDFERDEMLYRWLWICHGFGHSDAEEWADDMLETSSLHSDDDQITVALTHLELAELYLLGDDQVAATSLS